MTRYHVVGCGAIIALASSTATSLHAQSGALADSRDLRRTPVVEIFERNRDAVVNISATQFTTVRDRFGLFDDDAFDRMFDLPIGPPRTVRATSVGSGFVLHEDGYIVTNAHVVARTEDRTAIFSDGTELPAEVVSLDVAHDLAILRVAATKPLPTITLGRSDDLMVGESVVAIGNPFGFQHTVTSGVVSALNRDIEIDDRVHFTGLIQTDASINHGNSGGPLFNILGDLIGINTAIRGDAENIGFAIPVDQLRGLLPELLNIETRDRVAIGMTFNGGDGDGVTVESVATESAAADAGIRAGDRIVAVGDARVSSLVDYHIALLDRKPGDEVDLTIRRDGSTFGTSIDIRALPVPDGASLAQARLGVNVEQIGERTLADLGVAGRSAIQITDVNRDGPAYSVDARRGDFLVAINGAPAATLDELGLILEGVRPGDQVMITFARVRPGFRQQNTVPLRVD